MPPQVELRSVPSRHSDELSNARPDDRALVGSVLAGDPRVAARFHDRLRPVIEHALRRVLRSRRDDFEDLVQVTFERVIHGLAEDRFEGRSNLSTWVAAIAAHVALDALRRRFREQSRFAVVPSDLHADVRVAERQIEARSELDRIHGVLGRMKSVLAEVLVLHDVLGHDLQEVATITQVSLAAAQSRLFRARKDLLRRTKAKVAPGAKR